MKRLLQILVPWMVLIAAASAQTRTADVLYTHHEVPQPAWRVGDECFVSTEIVEGWGWTVDIAGQSAEISAEGKKASVLTRSIGARKTIPLRKTLGDMGIEANWLLGTDTLQVLSPLEAITIVDGQIEALSTFPIQLKAFVLEAPTRLVVDLYGAKLTESTKQKLQDGARLVQFRPNTVRMVIETSFVPDVPSENLAPSKSFKFALLRAGIPADPQLPKQQDQTQPAEPISEPKILPISVQQDNDRQAVVYIGQAGLKMPQPKYARPEMNILEITFPGLNMYLPEEYKLPAEGITAIAKLQGMDTVLTLTFSRPMGAELSPAANSMTISVWKPAVGNGKLAGKIIVVDAGHGGHDKGASRGGHSEKTLNLGMAKYLSQYLTEAGATVIMTRKTDVYVTLDGRCQIANKNGADFFISCHTNSSGSSGKQRGVTTYYHGGDEVSKILGECIQREMVKVAGIPDAGVKSDRRIYASGFKVLRDTNMPGVLLEMGFIDNASDRKRIVTAEFQKATMAAVVKGLKVFLGDTGK